MSQSAEAIDYMNKDYTKLERDLEVFSESNHLSIVINEELEEALIEMQSLKEQFTSNESAALIELCKNTVIETITGQFGLASLFIVKQDGGNVTTPHSFKNGITSTDSDQQKYGDFIANTNGSKKWTDVRKKTGYDDPLPEKRKIAFQTQEVIYDAYTGKPLPKDGRAHLDHIVSVKEIESNAANNLFMTPEQRAKMATNDKNLAFTAASANQSKGDTPMQDWISKVDPKTGQTKGEIYEIDEKIALKKDTEAREYIKKKTTVAGAKKYGLELVQTGGQDAVMMAAYSSIGVILREFTQAIFIEIHVTLRERGNESFSDILARFRERLENKFSEIKEKWQEILKGSMESALIAFFSNLLVFVINLVATTLKKLVTMIRAGFVSLVEAIKIMANPPEGMPKEEVNYQALKILTAGLIGAASLGLGAAIEKLLQSIPGLQPLMMFPIPFPGRETRTVSDIVAFTLSALVGGLVTTIVLYFMDKCRENSKKEGLQIQLVSQSGVVLQYKLAQTWMFLDDAYRCLENIAADTAYYIIAGEKVIKSSAKKVDKAIGDVVDARKELNEILKKGLLREEYYE